MVKPNRSTKGYALVSVLVIGVFAVMFMLSLAGMLISLMQSETATKQKAGLVDAAEVGLEYVMRDLNRSMDPDSGVATQFFVDESNIVSPTVTLPTGWLPDSNMTVKMRVRKLTESERIISNDFSLLYVPQAEPIDAAGINFQNSVKGGATEDLTKLVEITATNGVFSKSFRSVVLPSAGSSDSSVFPDNGMLALTHMRIKPRGNLNIKTHPSYGEFATNSDGSAKFALDLVSNKSLTINSSDGDVSLRADMVVSNNPQGAPGEFASIIGDNNVEIVGRFESNGGTQSSIQGTPGDNFSSGDNVLAQADLLADPDVTARTGVNASTPKTVGASNPPQEAAPVPEASLQVVDTAQGATTNDLTQFLNTTSGGDYFNGTTVPVTAHGTDPSSGADVSTYLSNGIMTSDNLGTVEFSTSTPAKIIVNGTNNSSAVNIDASKFVNTGSPENLQIFYDGSSNVNIDISSGQFNGFIYAPNARVTVRGTGSNPNGDFNGSIVGNNVNIVMSGTMNLVPDPGSVISGSGGGSGGGGTGGGGFNVYKASTFQEVNGVLVP